MTSFHVNKVKRNGSGIGVYSKQIVINNDRVMEEMKLEFIRILRYIFWRTRSLFNSRISFLEKGNKILRKCEES